MNKKFPGVIIMGISMLLMIIHGWNNQIILRGYFIVIAIALITSSIEYVRLSKQRSKDGKK